MIQRLILLALRMRNERKFVDLLRYLAPFVPDTTYAAHSSVHSSGDAYR